MRTRSAIILLATASSFALGGCLGKVKYPTFYALQLAPAPPVHTTETATVSVAVREFRSAEYLRRGAIVFRPSAEEIGFYDYSRWATDPPRTVTNAVVDRLRASGNFTHVNIYDGHSDIDYVLTGQLERLDEVDFGGAVRVEVALSAQLTANRTGKIVWENSASEVTTVDKRDVPAVVSTMDQAMDEALVKLLSSLPASTVTKSGL